MATFDVIFIGAGPAGYVGAIRCAQLGLTTAVIEKDKVGGTCVAWGCIPAKALLAAASVATQTRHAAEFGVQTGDLKFDFAVASKRAKTVSDQNVKGVEFLFKKNKITQIAGTARLAGGKSVVVKTADGKEERHEARKGVVLATGSRVRGLPQVGLELNGKTVISSDEALYMPNLGKTIAVIGGGAVGVEFADVFHAYGAKVHLIEMMPVLLPVEDAEVSATLGRSFRKRGIELHLGAKILSAKVAKDSVTIRLEVGEEKQDVKVDQVLVAAGRSVVTDNAGLKENGIQLNDKGFVKVDKNYQTTAPGVYAIGDVIGPPMLAHKGSREGVVVAEILAGHKSIHHVNYDNIPNATYCHPEVASIGLTEQQCKEKKLDYKVGKFPFSASGRARTSGETEGFVKIIRDAKYGEILGAHIIGAHATELIHELAVARENEYTVEELDLAIHAHPTLSEAVAEAALDSMGRMLHA